MIVNLHITGDCNLRCDYCYASPKSRAVMSLETARAALALAATEAPEVYVVFFGGEPLLHKPLLKQIVAECESGRFGETRFYYQLSTNGTLLEPDFVRWASEKRISISLSLDGDQQVQDAHRKDLQGNGTWQRVVERVPLLLQHNPYLHVLLVVSPDTAARLDQSLAFVFGLGVRHISTALDYSANWEGEAFRQLESAFKRAATLYEEKTRRGDRFFLSCFDSRIRTQVRGPCSEKERCSAGMYQFSVGPSGNLYPCVQFVGADKGSEQVLGHVSTVFDRQARDRFRAASEAKKEQCEGCVLQPRCSSWCACVNWATTGSLTRVSPVLCEQERVLIPLSDQIARRLFQKRNALFLHKHYNAAFPIVSVVEDLLERTGK